jgi:hypothetical protein
MIIQPLLHTHQLALTRLHIVTSSAFELGASSVTGQSSGTVPHNLYEHREDETETVDELLFGMWSVRVWAGTPDPPDTFSVVYHSIIPWKSRCSISIRSQLFSWKSFQLIVHSSCYRTALQCADSDGGGCRGGDSGSDRCSRWWRDVAEADPMNLPTIFALRRFSHHKISLGRTFIMKLIPRLGFSSEILSEQKRTRENET